ncbi:unnamed protein product [Lupinus luteus]|uniref:Uncharacterized protein n=1 Tax=Lupinus luteus TaxID=3873 RepID=A0AAV1X712_LUPLU
MPLTNRCNSNKSANSCHLGNRSKSFFIIHAILLSISLGNKTSFVTLNRTIRLDLDLKDPTRTYSTFVWW